MYIGLLVWSMATDELVFSDWAFAMLQRTQVDTGSVSWQVSNNHNHSVELVYSIWETYLHKIKVHLRRFHNAHTHFLYTEKPPGKVHHKDKTPISREKVKKSRSKNRHVRPAQWHVINLHATRFKANRTWSITDWKIALAEMTPYDSLKYWNSPRRV